MKLTDYASFVERDKEGLPLPEPIPLSSLTEMVHRWKPAIEHNEHACIYYYATSALLRRLMQLSHHSEIYKPLLGEKELVIIHASSEPIEDMQDIHRICAPLAGKRVVVAILGSEHLLEGDGIRLLKHMEMVSDMDNIVCLFFFSTNFLYPNAFTKIKSSAAVRSTIFHPIPGKNEANQFITYLSHKWDFTIDSNTKRKIVSVSGSHFLLIKQIAREIRDGHAHAMNVENDTIRGKLQYLWHSFSPPEQKVLRHAVFKNKEDDTLDPDSVAFLVKTGWITKKGGNHALTIPLLADYLRYSTREPESLTQSRSGHIYLRDVPLREMFSKQEYSILKLLVSHSPTVVTRETIASVLWGPSWDEHYSSWAIDKLISKIRHKITRLGISPNLSTHKGAGYSYATKPL